MLGGVRMNNILEIVAFLFYLALVVAIGVYFFVKGRKIQGGDKEYFLGPSPMRFIRKSIPFSFRYPAVSTASSGCFMSIILAAQRMDGTPADCLFRKNSSSTS